MERLKKTAVLLKLASQLIDKDSWCGETHLQKAVFFLQDLLGVQLDLTFVLYKHGPFSFDLREELSAMLADGLLEIKPQQEPYGPKLVPTERGKRLVDKYPVTLAKFSPRIDFVASKLGAKGAAELERLGTALLMKQREPGEDLDMLATQINAFKPHVSIDEAKRALEAVEDIMRQAEKHKAA